MPGGVARIEAVGRVLEHHLDFRAQGVVGKLQRREGSQILPAIENLAGAGLKQPHDHGGGCRFAAARFPDQPDAFPLADGEADAFDGMHRAGFAHIGFLEIDHVEQWVIADCAGWFGGSLFLGQEGADAGAPARRRLHQSVGIGMLRVGEEGDGIALLHDQPVLHHDDAVAILGRQPEIMGDQDRRHAARPDQIIHQIHHRFLRRDVKAGGRFVGDQEFRIAGERDGDDDALAHAAGEFKGIGLIAGGGVIDANSLQRRNGFFLRIGGGRLSVLPQHILDLVADLADRVEGGARVLENHRDFPPANVLHGGFAGAA